MIMASMIDVCEMLLNRLDAMETMTKLAYKNSVNTARQGRVEVLVNDSKIPVFIHGIPDSKELFGACFEINVSSNSQLIVPSYVKDQSSPFHPFVKKMAKGDETLYERVISELKFETDAPRITMDESGLQAGDEREVGDVVISAWCCSKYPIDRVKFSFQDEIYIDDFHGDLDSTVRDIIVPIMSEIYSHHIVEIIVRPYGGRMQRLIMEFNCEGVAIPKICIPGAREYLQEYDYKKIGYVWGPLDYSKREKLLEKLEGLE